MMSFKTLSLLTASLLAVSTCGWTQEPARQPAPAARQPAATGAANAEQQGRVTRAKDMLGLEVLNEQGESYGVIDDLLLNKKSGQIEYLLVSSDQDSKELYPLPWKAVTLYQGETAEEQYVILGMEKEKFVKAPTIARQQLPTMTYTQWNAYVPQVTTYYGNVRPAEARAIRRTARAIRRAVD
jgi:sporulation protein YlmC with PRC-barrel domain